MSERKTRIDRLRAVGALAAGLSHEFATPLNTAKLKLARLGRTHDLGDDADLDTAAEALDRCEEILRRMAGSQLEAAGLQLEVVDVTDPVGRSESSVGRRGLAALALPGALGGVFSSTFNLRTARPRIAHRADAIQKRTTIRVSGQPWN